MIRQPSLPARRRPMAIKVSAAERHARPALRLRWSWLLLAILVLLVAAAVASTIVLVR